MDREAEGYLKVELCYVDGKYNRVIGYVIIFFVVYDLNFREMIKIVIMECLLESKNIGFFRIYFNVALK